LGVTLKVSRTTGHVKEEFTMMGWYGGGMGGFGLLGMGLFWLILLGLIVWLVTRLLPGSRDDQPAPSTGESAVEILDRRMANGEIDTQAWQSQRAALLTAQSERR
jgi:putative membrane protein